MAENVIIVDDDANTQLTRFSVFYERIIILYISSSSSSSSVKLLIWKQTKEINQTSFDNKMKTNYSFFLHIHLLSTKKKRMIKMIMMTKLYIEMKCVCVCVCENLANQDEKKNRKWLQNQCFNVGSDRI